MSMDECSFVVNLLYKADYSSVRSLILMTESGAFVKTEFIRLCLNLSQ